MFMLAGIFVSGNGPSLNSNVGMRFQSQMTIAYALYGGFSGIGAAVGPISLVRSATHSAWRPASGPGQWQA
jgi:hypothetical protein